MPGKSRDQKFRIAGCKIEINTDLELLLCVESADTECFKNLIIINDFCTEKFWPRDLIGILLKNQL